MLKDEDLAGQSKYVVKFSRRKDTVYGEKIEKAIIE